MGGLKINASFKNGAVAVFMDLRRNIWVKILRKKAEPVYEVEYY